MTLIPKICIKHIFGFRWRYSDARFPLYVSTHDVKSVRHLFQSFTPGDYYFSSGENGCRDLFHFLRWFEFYFHRRIRFWLERYRKYIRKVTEMLRHFYQVDVVVQTIITIDHHHPEVVGIDEVFHAKVRLENNLELLNDTTTIKQVTTPCHLN